MGFENEPYRDEVGGKLVDLGQNVESEGNGHQQHVLDVALSNSCRGKSSLTPVNNDSNFKSRKLVIKIKCGKESRPVDLGLVGDDIPGSVRDNEKRKGKGKDNRSSVGKKRKVDEGKSMGSMGKKRNAEKGEKKSRVRKSRRLGMRDNDADSEIKEMWDSIVDGNSKDDEGGTRVVDEDNFIADNYVDPQAKVRAVDREIEELFKFGKKKKKEKSPAETLSLAENVVEELLMAADKDAELNRQEKPAITKLNNLYLLTDIIPRKHLLQDLLSNGVLIALRLWLEPLPDKSLPCIDVRAAVFECLNNLGVDLDQFDHREMVKDSGIGKAIMFYYKYDEEITSTRKLAKELVEKWSRAIFDISTSFEDIHNFKDKRTYRMPPVRKAMSNAAAARASLNDDLPELSQGRKSDPSSSRGHASRPEAMSMDFVVRPQSKVDPEAVRARAKRTAQNQPRAKLMKKLQQLSAPKRKQLQAVKLSAEGRGMVKYM